ncbi:hypothetical protein [Amycolatopsis albispora]|uniref:Uncharacterized protein n=1 Tax=Amycolatopsis albispora TaxID=1804986 RepID=A0A344L9U3_9PSEU|nr:hypothetical protein [Amycolatopsis albispora]AXB44817.1 hypothetical protein A4R43_21850 [Amycolatopsis albispora]
MATKRSLAEHLGGPLPAGIDALTEAEQAELAEAFGEARRRQSAALARAAEEGLKYVPSMLRGTVRRVVGL